MRSFYGYRSIPFRGVTTALFVALAVTLIVAASPTFWHVSTQAELLRGELEQLSVDESGQLTLSPEAELIHESTAPFVWAIVPNDSGGFWIATGDEGRVYEIDDDGESSVFFDAAETEVHALARRPEGGLYVGTSPNGKVYEVQVDGQSTTLVDLEERYIWSMVVGPDKALYVATGTQGIIYRIAADGTAAHFYNTNTTNVLSLAFDSQGRLLAGTESPGRLLRINSNRKGFVLLDSEFGELRSLRVAKDGTIYLAGIHDGQTSRQSPPMQATTTVQKDTTDAEISIEGTQIEGGAVIRVKPDGVWDVIWQSPHDVPYDLLIDSTDALIVGTGSDGRLYRLVGNPVTATLLTRVAAGQITSMAYAPEGRLHFATANPGKLFVLSDSLAAEGTYHSDILDARTIATWGAIRWSSSEPSGSQVELFTRTGNTGDPDEMWSDWSDGYNIADGQQITSPKARYLQWRAILKRSASTPILTSVTTFYLPRNVAPTVTSITQYPAGTAFQETFAGAEMDLAGYDPVASNNAPPIRLESEARTQSGQSTLGRRVYRKGLQTFGWIAEDPDSDRLEYSVRYRAEDSSVWILLMDGLTEPIFVWDTVSVPDGRYLVIIEASDAPANSPQTALTGRRSTSVFDIDNTPPRIDIHSVQVGSNRISILFTAQDAQSIIERVEFSFDEHLWEVIYPIDGIADSRLESFEVISPEGEAPGRLLVRATDAMNNTANSSAALGNSRR